MRKNLHPVTARMCEKVPSIQRSKICDNCRKEVAKLLQLVFQIQNQEVNVDPPASFASLNQCLGEIGETPIDKSKLQRSTKYTKQKITTAVKKVVASNIVSDEDEILAQLKQKFHSCTENSEKVQILTVLPKSWSIRKIGASNYMVRKVKDLVREKGIMSTPNPKLGNPLASHTVHLLRV